MRRGIAHAWVLSSAYMMASDVWETQESAESELAKVRGENDFTAKEVSRHADRLTAFLSVNPTRAHAIEEIDRCVDEHGMVGLKLHCWNSLVDVRNDDHRQALRTVLEHASARNLAVMVHAFNGQVRDFGKRDVEIWTRELILPLAKLRICFAHLGGAGGFFPPIQKTFAALVDQLGPESDAADRVFVDLSAVLIGKNSLGMPEIPQAAKDRDGRPS